MLIHTDCRFFRGHIPCRPHKKEGVHCDGCPHYDKIDKKILIIKLGAMGDVIRTTPLLTRLREVYPHAEVTWLTLYPEAVPSVVDRVYPFDLKSIVILKATHYDLVLNLDKDYEACALTNALDAETKMGFWLKDGIPANIDELGYHKWLTGLFDDVNKANIKSYPEEIFEICGFKYNKEEYILDNPRSGEFGDVRKKERLVGFNTGCGGRWTTRLWPEEHWVELAQSLMDEKTDVLLLGGRDEHEKNMRIAEKTGCMYLGTFPLDMFIGLVGRCDLVVTGVTMGMHLAIGLKKKIVLLNNCFNRNEFELFGLGEIVEPPLDCLGCFKGTCETDCMRLIAPQTVAGACKRLLG